MTENTNQDYYFDASGRLVMTRHYHLKRGYCCGNGCKHCPFDYEGVNNPLLRQQLINQQTD
ncbi:MAG: hypothetical protein H6608_11925 [Flavobacteriales bacterium]|nr:hypothetical protein [Bacteroidota bacterium]MCB9241837.1 hypothetical protein [Flavobacteriales bacterium]